MNAVGKMLHGILSSSKCFLETILNDTARVLRMDELGAREFWT